MLRSSESVWLAIGLAAAVLCASCGGTSEDLAKGGTPDGQAPPPSNDASTPAADGSTTPPSVDSGSPDAADDAGVPAARNSTCTPTSAQTGSIANTEHGRLDGTLVYVLPLGGSYACNGDNSHVHLQVEVSGLVYDVAVDVGSTGDDVGMYEETLAVPGGAWAEGWHGTDSLAYPTLGLSSTEFPTTSPTQIAANVESLLEDTSKISIFCTAYTPQGNGCHDVHYEDGSGEDGAIVLNPTSPSSPILFFRFEGQTF
ncbi:MAG: hypothetical protein ACLQVI_38380 [Polyangiaceae bacterium]|jgi:hypothetical protein